MRISGKPGTTSLSTAKGNWVVSRERGTGYKGVRCSRWLCLHLAPLKRGIRFHDGNEYFNRNMPRGLFFFHRQSNFNYHINSPRRASLSLSLSSFKHPRSETPVASGGFLSLTNGSRAEKFN